MKRKASRPFRWIVRMCVGIFIVFLAAREAAPTILARTVMLTPVPIAELNLEPILTQNDDLPVGVTGADVSNTATEMFDAMPDAAYVITQQLARGEQQVGSVSVFLYGDARARDTAYGVIRGGMGETKPINGLGDWGVVGSPAEARVKSRVMSGDILFRRCGAVVHVRIITAKNSHVTAYAERLDKRLQPLVCR